MFFYFFCSYGVCAACSYAFFFVKQKTAYELRISDWSSDVCSSDLASLLWVGWFGFNAGSNLEANAVTGVAFINTMVATCAAAVSWSLVEQEIGRASCRERVCQ